MIQTSNKRKKGPHHNHFKFLNAVLHELLVTAFLGERESERGSHSNS